MNAAEGKAELGRVFRNVLDQIHDVGHRLVKAGEHSTAGIAFVAHALLHQFLADDAAPQPSTSALAPPTETAPRCRHAFDSVTGQCAICGAVRKRAPRATTPPAGGAP